MRSQQKLTTIFEYLVDYIGKNGYSPSYRDIAAATSIKSIASVKDCLVDMEKLGLIEVSSNKSRAIKIVGKATDKNFKRVSLIGKVAAGKPITAIENIETDIPLPTEVFGTLDGVFCLRVSGDSMIDAGILDGDLVLVKKQEAAENGETVVAMINDEVTVKTLRHKGNTVELIPHNPSYSPIVINASDDVSFSILGKVIGLIRTNCK